MRLSGAFLIFLILSAGTRGQIVDEDAVARAKVFVERYAPESLAETPVIYREAMPNSPGGPGQVIHVGFGEVVVFLDGSGSLKGFGNMRADAQLPRSGLDRYPTDAEAWNALDTTLQGVQLPDGLARKRLLREGRSGRPYVLDFLMHPRPYGHAAAGGDQVTAEIHRVTGKLLVLSVSRGWTYEPPNVRVTPVGAIQSVVGAYGGSAEEWRAELEYVSVADPDAPPETRQLRAARRMRLHYSVWSARGEATVDSVTGRIVRFSKPALDDHGTSALGSASATSDNGRAEVGGGTKSRREASGYDPNAVEETTGRIPSLSLLALLSGIGALFVGRRTLRTRPAWLICGWVAIVMALAGLWTWWGNRDALPSELVRGIELAKVVSPAVFLDQPRLAPIPSPTEEPWEPSYSVRASMGLVWTVVDRDGRLVSFRDSTEAARAPLSGLERFTSDGEAWAALDSILDRLDPPVDLIHRVLVRTGPPARPFEYMFALRPKPHGYESRGGNEVLCVMNRASGVVKELSISRGWSYEPPDVCITQDQAIANAVARCGYPKEEWTCRLEYWSTGNRDAPEESRALHARREIRLHYYLEHSRKQHNGPLVSTVKTLLLVDSVTGKVVDEAVDAKSLGR